MECERPSPRGGCSREVDMLLMCVLSAVAAGCGCDNDRLRQVDHCSIESNRAAPEICNDKDDNCNCLSDTNQDGVVCGPGDEGVDEGCDDDSDGFCDPTVPIDGRPTTCARSFDFCLPGTSCDAPVADCDDGAPTTHPGAPELCDGKDNDCNRLVDDAVRTETDARVGQVCGQDVVPASKVGIGVCALGKTACMGGAIACEGAVGPAAEVCDGKDNDCNGVKDDGAHLFELCQSPDNPLLVGECRPGVYACVNGRMDRTRCIGEVKPVTELCDGKDNDCDTRIDQDCGVSLVCPPDTTTPVGVPVTLVASATSRSGTIAGYTWTAISGPAGGIGTPGQWNPDPPIADTEAFLPMSVGVYILRITATDDTGATASCDTKVTALNYGLRIELTWDGSADMDLHVHNGGTSSWFTSPGDCYYSNRTPDWDVIGTTADDPNLDTDNTSAYGPENVRILTPVMGETYTIGVHNYTRGAGRVATLRVFCGQTTVPQATVVSRAFTGSNSGNCTSNDFWKAASVVFTSGTCQVTSIDSWSTSDARCQAF